MAWSSHSATADSAFQMLDQMHCYYNTGALRLDLGILRTFQRYAGNRKDVEDIGLASLLGKVEAQVKEVEQYISTVFKRECLHLLSYESFSRDSLRAVESFFHWKIWNLMPEMKQAYADYLSKYSLSSAAASTTDDFLIWNELSHSIKQNLIDIKNNLSSRGLGENNLKGWIDTIHVNLSSLSKFIAGVKRELDPHRECEDFRAFLRDAALRAAHLSFLCWSEELDNRTAEEIIVMLSDLHHTMNPHRPETIDMYFCVLRSSSTLNKPETEELVRPYVDIILRRMNVTKAFKEELVFLFLFVINTPPGDFSEDERQIWTDIKQLVRDAASLPRVTTGQGNYLNFKLVTMIKLLKAETVLFQLHRRIGLMGRSLDPMDTLLQGLSSPHTYPEATEAWEFIFTCVQEVGRQARLVHQSFHQDKMTKSGSWQALLQLRLQIKLLKANSFSVELLNNGASAMLPLKGLIETLHEELTFLIRIVMKQSEVDAKVEALFWKHVEEVSVGVISLYHNFLDVENTEDMIRGMKPPLSGLLNKIELFMAERKPANLHVEMINFPKTNGLGFIDFLLKNMRELLNYKADLFASMNPQLETLMGDLESSRSLLKNIGKKGIEHQELKDLRERVINLAYEAEYVIDSIVVQNHDEAHGLSRINYVSQWIRHMKMQVTKVYGEISPDVGVPSVVQKSNHMISHDSNTPRINEVMVSLVDQEEKIMDLLTSGSLKRNVVSIVGMPGIGKTTLAKKMYDDPKVTFHFHIRAWCSVSQGYKKRELLLDILRCIIVLTEDILEKSTEDLEHKLCQQLRRRKYLIVMDDVWNTGAWHELQQSFPDDENRSRILVTTRLLEVALKVKSTIDPHHLRPLSDKESWTLLQKKLFQEEGCPEELSGVGRQIARNCGGLPLAVVAIAGLLERSDKTQNWWIQIAKNLSSRIIDDPQTRCKDILELSYKHLPDFLKPCFLYLGALMENREIPVQKLIRIWIAEGFVQETATTKSLEDNAEEYLRDLIQRSLVMVAKRRSNGGAKTCRLHDMLRDLCLTRCKEEKFLHLITGYDERFASSSDGLDYGVPFDYPYPSESMTYEDYRLCISSKRKHFVMLRPSAALARSLLFLATKDMYPRCPYDVSFIAENFKLLHVLDLESINMGISFPNGFAVLVQLRYLAVSGDIDFIPSSVADLWNLETLLVKGLKGRVALPDSIWSMGRLRHVHVTNQATFISIKDEKFENCPH